MDASDGIGVYGEAKAEYTRQLCSFLVPALETYFLDLLSDVKSNEKYQKRFLWVFQDALKQFPDWNVDKVQRETEKIQSSTKCDYLEELLTAVFIAHTKVLSAIRLTTKQKKLQITIPKLDHFLHRTMSECARQLWSNAYLFADSGPAIERQKNLRQVEQLLYEGVLQSIRGMLPVKSILKEYLSEDVEESTTEAQDKQEEDTAPIVHEESIVAAPAEPPKEEKEEEKEAEKEVPEEQTKEVESTPPKVILEESYNEPLDLSGSTPVAPPPSPSTPSVPTIVVDTEPPSVGFTHMDAVLDTDNPEQTTIRLSNQIESEENQEITHIEFDEKSPAEEVDDYEDLDNETIPVGEDEFEKL
jgi:hypothetical protein